jgi:hypothetical protein
MQNRARKVNEQKTRKQRRGGWKYERGIYIYLSLSLGVSLYLSKSLHRVRVGGGGGAN